MEIIYKNIDDLIPYENNPRINDNAIEPVANSISRFKFRNPILLDNNGVVVAGHTRLRAAKKLGITEVPCIIIDDLSPEEIKAYRIADNKTGEFAEFDEEKLRLEFEELKEAGFDDIEAMGFNEIEWMMITDEDEEEGEDVAPDVFDKKQYAEYEQKALEENIEAYNVIIACYSEEDKEWLKGIIGEEDRLKRFYKAPELIERMGDWGE